ncbi:hypothetical protein SDRG_00794 [Saprolegnia diclina VS20]|uniref:BEACH domain-containing protein n=1 Tax=Saprolegnia diclina (strain VS20) TaxID=1156394 RepID=T0SFX7_SAPDV|nr:hypothetical protein SDRG_00794 [Saprolegnia diclina VS20]EQC41942.1 hypothetical protein SDRG_00794 [Saprolegnia diclina VS20]|eukprot:XP_008604511.1 hypothetical protein SDRG_00794 [Saprolegnia diclina VS20]
MLGRQSTPGAKTVQGRFNLLLLEDGEYFLDDFSVFRYPDPVFTCLTFHHCKQRKVQGRLKLCTRSLMFEPQDPILPILKFPFRDMALPPSGEIFEDETKQIYLSFECGLAVEMKERGLDHPYVARVLADSSVMSSKFIFSFAHSKVHDVVDAIAPLYALAHTKNILNKIDEETRLAPILDPRHTDVFDPSLLADFRERPLLKRGKVVNRIVPLLKYPGTLMLTNLRVYFQPAQVNNVGDPVLNFAYTKVTALHKRRHMLKQCGLEVRLDDGASHLYSFETMVDRDEIYDLLKPNVGHIGDAAKIPEMLAKWQAGGVSNFEYLSFLNDQAGRTVNDLTQYPVFPWVVADYTSRELDLTKSSTFRDLSKPVGALNPDRLSYFQQRFEAMPSGMEAEGLPPPFLYGTHYSTPGYVLFYLVRMAPEYMLCLQNGKFDAADRLFKSIHGTWQSCLSNHADLKELIPAFYDVDAAPEWLSNVKNLDLGTTQQLERVGDVELPPWAHSPREFVAKLREALESEHVSAHLHEWIDLIFGCKQQGDAAIAANNLFYYLSYEGAVNLETITDPIEKCSFEAQIQEFGQTPKLLFLSPHPSRADVAAAASLELAPSEPVVHVAPVVPSAPAPPAPSPVPSPDKEASTPTSARRSVFGFARPTLSLNGIKASLRRRLERKNWGWTFDSQSPASGSMWEESLPHYFHSQALTACVLSKDGKYAFSTAHDGTFKLSATSDGSVRRSYTCGGAAVACDVSPDEKFVFFAALDACVNMVALETGRVGKLPTGAAVVGLAVLDDARFVTADVAGAVKLWQYGPTGMLSTPVAVMDDAGAPITCLDVNSDGSVAVVGTATGVVCLLDLRSMTSVASVPTGAERIVAVSFGMAGTHFVCATDESELLVVSIDGVEQARLRLPDDANIQCMVSDGTYAITGASNGGIYIWQLQTASMELEKKCIVSIGHGKKRPVTTITVSSNGQTIVAGAQDGSMRLWSMKKKATRGRLGYFS